MKSSLTINLFIHSLWYASKRLLMIPALLMSVLLLVSLFSEPVYAQNTSTTNSNSSSISQSMTGFPDLSAITLSTNDDGTQEYSISIQVLLLMTTLTFIPAILLMMTSFTRIIIVFAILRQALGLQQSPSNQILIGMTLFLTLFIMTPVINEVNETALQPYVAEQISSDQAIENVIGPFHRFMMGQTRESDLKLFMDIANVPAVDTPDQVPLTVLIPSFITSELKTAFQIGFILFIPFLVIDLVVASVLMAMGMMMLSPLIISLPFKLMLFVLVDGWAMIMGTLASSFGI